MSITHNYFFLFMQFFKYYCPFCSPSNQLYKTRSDGVKLCAICNDPLLKVPVLKPIRVFASVTAIAFLAPLLVMIYYSFNGNNHNRQHSHYFSSIIFR